MFEIYFSGEVFNLMITLALITFEEIIEKKLDCNESTRAFLFLKFLNNKYEQIIFFTNRFLFL